MSKHLHVLSTRHAHEEAVPSQQARHRPIPTPIPDHHPPSPSSTLLLLFPHPLGLRFPSLPQPLKYTLTILIRLQLGNLHLAGRDAEGHALAVALLAGDALDVDDVFEAVDGDDFALAAFVGAARDEDFVVFADGDRADLWVGGGGGLVRALEEEWLSV